MKQYYDIIVVGGGPGGSYAAKSAAEQGVSVLLLEKDKEIGIPVRCGEGILISFLNKLVEIKKEWIAQEITKAQVIAPDGTEIDLVFDDKSVILHRDLFDKDLAEMASQAGAEIETEAYVYGLLSKDNAVSGVLVNHRGDELEISCSIVIGADGIESRIGRWGGLKTHVPPIGIMSCAQMTLSGIDIDPSCVQFYFGNHIAPKGYLWVFPKGKGIANIGLGTLKDSIEQKPVIESLKAFIREKFENYSICSTVAGGVSAVPTLKEIVNDGLMLVGDAARQADPISGGGIYNAMKAGQMAGKIAAEAIQSGDVSKKRLSIYENRWKKTEGKSIERSYRLMQAKNRFSDEELNHIGHALKKVPQSKRTILQIFKTAFIQKPGLIMDAIKFLK